MWSLQTDRAASPTSRRPSGVVVSRRVRDAGLVMLVIAGHVASIAAILTAMTDLPTVHASAGGAQGVTVTLVSAATSTAATSVAKPVVAPLEKTVTRQSAKPVVRQRPSPHVLTTNRADARPTAAPEERPTAIASAPSPEKSATARPIAAASAPSVPASSTAATADASSAQSNARPTTGAAGAIKKISADEMGHLGCRIPAPEYPAKAKRLGQSGVVSVALTIGVDGHITGVSVAKSSGFEDLDRSAMEAVSAGVCEPYTSSGQTMAVSTVQPIAFGLND